MKKLIFWVFIPLSLLFTGCAKVPLATELADQQAKLFQAPANDQASVYIYRNSHYGGGLKKVVYIDGQAIGQTAPFTYFHVLVHPGERTISTESEFSRKDLRINLAPGEIAFLRNYITFGVFIAGASLEVIPAEEAKEDILDCCELALPFSKTEVY